MPSARHNQGPHAAVKKSHSTWGELERIPIWQLKPLLTTFAGSG